MGFGLALAGGGTRGAAHVGVLRALEEAGLVPDAIAGASAGGIVAGLYAAGLSAGRLQEVMREIASAGIRLMDPDYWGIVKTIGQFFTFQPLSLQSLIKGEKLRNYWCKLTGGKTMRDAAIRLVIPTVDLKTGRTVVYTNTLLGTRSVENTVWSTNGLLCEVMMATSAVPAVFRPRALEDALLVDGGVTDNLPVDLLIAAGVPNVLAVDICRRYKIPERNNLLETTAHSFAIMSDRLKEHISTGERLLLRPDLPEKAGLLTFEYMEDCMNAGYEAAKEHIPEIRYLLTET